MFTYHSQVKRQKGYNRSMTTTDQVDKQVPNPTGKGGFGDNPQNRNPGGWVKSDTPRFKLEQMMKLGSADLQDVVDNPQSPVFETKLAQAILDGQWRETKEMIQEVYGKPKESVDVTSGGEPIKALVEFKSADN